MKEVSQEVIDAMNTIKDFCAEYEPAKWRPELFI